MEILKKKKWRQVLWTHFYVLVIYSPHTGGGGGGLVAKSFQLLWPHRLQPARLLCPWDSPWDFGKNAGVGCHFFLQGISPTHKVILAKWASSPISIPNSLPREMDRLSLGWEVAHDLLNYGQVTVWSTTKEGPPLMKKGRNRKRNSGGPWEDTQIFIPA